MIGLKLQTQLPIDPGEFGTSFRQQPRSGTAAKDNPDPPRPLKAQPNANGIFQTDGCNAGTFDGYIRVALARALARSGHSDFIKDLRGGWWFLRDRDRSHAGQQRKDPECWCSHIGGLKAARCDRRPNVTPADNGVNDRGRNTLT
jgi:hypothetical protein